MIKKNYYSKYKQILCFQMLCPENCLLLQSRLFDGEQAQICRGRSTGGQGAMVACSQQGQQSMSIYQTTDVKSVHVSVRSHREH